MDTPWIAVLVAVIVTAPYLLLPLALLDPKSYRSSRILRCPEGGKLAEVETKASRTDSSSGKPLGKVGQCSLWTRRNGCAQTCLTTEQR